MAKLSALLRSHYSFYTVIVIKGRKLDDLEIERYTAIEMFFLM